MTGAAIVVLSIAGVGLAVLAEVASFMFLISYGLVHVAVIELRPCDDSYDPQFCIPDPLYPAVPVLGILATVGVMTQMKPVVIAGGVAVSIAGALWQVLWV